MVVVVRLILVSLYANDCYKLITFVVGSSYDFLSLLVIIILELWNEVCPLQVHKWTVRPSSCYKYTYDNTPLHLYPLLVAEQVPDRYRPEEQLALEHAHEYKNVFHIVLDQASVANDCCAFCCPVPFQLFFLLKIHVTVKEYNELLKAVGSTQSLTMSYNRSGISSQAVINL